jgi:hypothetical protein
METDCVSETSEVFKKLTPLSLRTETECVSETSEVFKQWTPLSLRMETECVSETSDVFQQLTRLSAQEEVILLYVRPLVLAAMDAFTFQITW